MAIELFGFQIGKKEDETKEAVAVPSFAPPPSEDGAMEIAPGGVYGTYVDLEGTAKTEAELVTRYREMAMQPEAELAVDDIVNDAIIFSDDVEVPSVQVKLDRSKLPANIKKSIHSEFTEILKLLNFNNNSYDIFKRWYVDGRLYYHIMIDVKKPRAGIKELRYIDPRKIRKVREPKKKQGQLGQNTPAGKKNEVHLGYNEYFLYNPKGLQSSQQGLKVSKDSVCHVTSGQMDQRSKLVLGYLHKAIKPLNQLRMLEDATVIYRLARAPERRIFYIDVGNLPKAKAEQYLRDMMVKHKNRLVYDAATGEVRDDRKFMTMLEDFWLPRREGGRGTEITTLPGGQNLGEMDDVEYFKKKLYKALNVPSTRMEADNQFNIGRASEITRDEVKFAKFINRLRKRFSILFDTLLETQLILKGITTKQDWKEIKEHIYYDFLEDNHYQELKETEVLESRLRMLGEVAQFTEDYFSKAWVKRNILRMNDDDIKLIDQEIKKEQNAGEYEGDDEDQGQDQSQGAPPEPRSPAAQPQTPDAPVPPVQEAANTVPFEPPSKPSKEEKELLESMSRFMDSMAEIESDDEDDR